MTNAGHSVRSIRVDKVHARPGAETSVGLVADTDHGDVYVVATNADLPAGPTVAVVEHGDHRYALWLHPSDPHLPGLAIASDAQRLRERMESNGIEACFESVTFLGYRPMRRAVLRTEGDEEYFIKVVRPSAASRLVDASRALGSLTPRVIDLGAGIVAYERARGEALVERLARHADSIDPVRLWNAISVALDSLSDRVSDLPRRPSWTDRRGDYASHAVGRGLDASVVRSIMESIERGLIDHDDVPTHGDLHLANVWIAQEEADFAVTSLIDVDTVGPGVRADDYGCLIAHVAALEVLDPKGYAAMPSLARALADHVVTLDDAQDAPVRAAAVLLSLASTTEDARQAQQWLSLAHEFATTSFSSVRAGAV